MVDPHDLPGMAERIARIKTRQTTGGGPTDGGDDMEHRVSTLEKTFEKMDGKLERVLEAIGDLKVSNARIEAHLETKASSVEVAEIKGRVNSLPSTWQMITLVIGVVGTILGGAFLILKFGLTHAP